VTKDLTYEAWQRFAGREPVETLEERLEGDMEPVCDACGSYQVPLGTYPHYRCGECGRDL
jgi:tRNA(Ile2) C34 agmatinyltransferase TiaS